MSALTETTAAGKAKLDAGLLAKILFLLLALGLLLAAPRADGIRSLSLIFSSIVLEAVPFMLVGALAGGLIESFVSRERMTALLPKRGWITVFIAAGMGLIFPVCECAVVPVVRRLARKGLPASAAIAYLLGGPIFNPIVAASTALAYKFDWSVVALRMFFGYAIAVTVGLLMDWIFAGESVFADNLHDAPAPPCSCGCGHTHEHGHAHSHAPAPEHAHAHQHAETAPCGCDHAHDHGHAHAPAGGEIDSFRGKLVSAFRHAADDFLGVGHFLIIGAFIAALAQTYVNRSIFLSLSSYPVVPLLMMMALAILLNLCSEADAFIAASFRTLMPQSAQLAFLLTGPMFDLKLLLMYQSVFRRRAIAVLSGLILFTVLCASLAIEGMEGFLS